MCPLDLFNISVNSAKSSIFWRKRSILAIPRKQGWNSLILAILRSMGVPPPSFWHFLKHFNGSFAYYPELPPPPLKKSRFWGFSGRGIFCTFLHTPPEKVIFWNSPKRCMWLLFWNTPQKGDSGFFYVETPLQAHLELGGPEAWFSKGLIF